VTTETASHDAAADILGEVLKLEAQIIERGNSLLVGLGVQK